MLITLARVRVRVIPVLAVIHGSNNSLDRNARASTGIHWVRHSCTSGTWQTRGSFSRRGERRNNIP